MKAGWKTSEFWVAVTTVLVNLFGETLGIESESSGTLIASLASVGYILSRGIAKRSQ